jgi:hypothetical protein
VKFYGEPNGEASGYSAGETWHISFDGRGTVEVKDEAIAAALTLATEHPDSPVSLKAKKGVSESA